MFIIYADAPINYSLSFQDPASEWMLGIIKLHDIIIFYLIILFVVVLWSFTSLFLNKDYLGNLAHGNLIELIWTIIPSLILWSIGIPSLKLLYQMDEVLDSEVTVKAIGNKNCQYSCRGVNLTLAYWLMLKNKKKGTSPQLRGQINENNRMVSILVPFRTQNLKGNILSGSKRFFHTSSIRSARRIGPHNIDVISIQIGSLLGDSHAQARNVKIMDGIRFTFRQSIIHKEYLLWLFDFFKSRGYCAVLREEVTQLKGYDKDYYRYTFTTFTFKSQNWIHKNFYKNGKKVIPTDIDQYLTPLALAVWIMDDGGYTNTGVKLSTQCFSKKEVILLKNIQVNKYNLVCTIRKTTKPDRFIIYIWKESMPTLTKIIKPYLHPSMFYKLNL